MIEINLKRGCCRVEHELLDLIKQADLAIKQEKFDELMDFYTEDAILVVKPGMIARGKSEIKQAFIKIAAYFNNIQVQISFSIVKNF